MSDQDVDETRVCRMLKNAFADVPCPDSFKKADGRGPLAHEIALELRRNFYNYEPEEVHYLLPLILEELINSRTGDEIETDDAERLVLQLDPLQINNELVRAVSLQQFSAFSQQQAEAICEFLRMARTWNDLSRFTKWVDTSMEYWCSRAAGLSIR
ncbi:MAG TPA: DUF6714 family protein [Pyrinomonadaceae bacterium]|nr:DUF6714 family protein [Pyrinomonadaceae bacterium]